MPPPPGPAGRRTERPEIAEARREAEAALQDAEFQLAWIDYCTAQAYPAKSPERTAALQKAGKEFDDVFQQNRTGAGQTVGLYAHLWHGKAAEELGDDQLALDIYDEVLAGAADPAERTAATGLESLFAQTQYFRLLIVAKQNPQQFLSEAKAWLEQYRRLRQTDGYQGVALELAKAKLAAAEKAAGPEKTKRTSEALQILIEMAKTRSQYQGEAILLRRDGIESGGKIGPRHPHVRGGRGAGRRRDGRLAVGPRPRRLRQSARHRPRAETQRSGGNQSGAGGVGPRPLQHRLRSVQERKAERVHRLGRRSSSSRIRRRRRFGKTAPLRPKRRRWRSRRR